MFIYSICEKAVNVPRQKMVKQVAIVVLILTLVAVKGAIQIDLPAGRNKCFGEELTKDQVAKGSFEVLSGSSEGALPEVIFKVRKQRDVKYSTTATTGSFNIIADATGEHHVCFQSPVDARVSFEFLRGVAAKDYDEMAKLEHLRPIETRIQQMLDTMDEIKSEMSLVRRREGHLRELNEKMYSRVTWLSATSVAVLLVVTIWQIMYLKNFFRTKKLI